MKLDTNFIRPFIEGTTHTLEVQCSMPSKAGKPFVRDAGFSQDIDIAGVIGLTCDSFTGTITLCFPAAVFLKLMGNMLDEEYSEITPDLEDGAAELLNIIFGQAKRVLNDQGYNIEKAIPTVVTGKIKSTHALTKSPTFMIPFETEAGQFFVQITTEESE